MARTGMANLILELRLLTETSATDYTINSVQYWTDDQLQRVLDRYYTLVNELPLAPVPERVGSEFVYKDYSAAPYQNFEEADSGTTRWRIYNSSGTEISSANYAVEYINGLIRFTTDQDGEVYFLRGYSYDLFRAAAYVWRQKAGHVSQIAATTGSIVEWESDNHRVKRNAVSSLSQAYLDRAKEFERMSPARSITKVRGDLL